MPVHFFVATLLQMIQQDSYWMVSDILGLAEAIRNIYGHNCCKCRQNFVATLEQPDIVTTTLLQPFRNELELKTRRSYEFFSTLLLLLIPCLPRDMITLNTHKQFNIF
jgi:hypothetical protein